MAVFAVLAILAGTAVGAQESVTGGIEFKPTGTPGLETIYLTGVGVGDPGGFLRIEVWANEISELYGLGFALQFPHKLLKFPKSRSTLFSKGPFLSGESGDEIILLVRQVGKEIIVGLSRKGDVGGVSGSGHLMTLEFRGLEVAGKRALRFRRQSAFGPTGTEMENVSWNSGKVIVTLPE